MPEVPKATVLLVEDNEELNAINREALQMEGYRVLAAQTLAAAESLLQEETVDVMVLDVLLPDGSGLDLCRRLRERRDVPILFLSALGEPTQRVEGLRAGGDDYLGKPYLIEELCARVEALHRRSGLHGRQNGQQRMDLEPLVLDINTMRAYFCERDLLLTPREFALLCALAKNEGQILSYSELYQIAWGMNAVDEVSAVRKQISRLRYKMGVEMDAYFILKSYYGKGYALKRTGKA